MQGYYCFTKLKKLYPKSKHQKEQLGDSYCCMNKDTVL